MKWKDTISSKCRYGEIAGKIWGSWDILWEDAEDDYQGHAAFVAKNGNIYCFYEWWYGSCSGCDGWEAAEMSETDILLTMFKEAILFENKQEIIKWTENACELKLGNGRSNYSMEEGGGLAAGIDMLKGGAVERFQAIRKALGLKSFNFEDCEEKEDAGGNER
jgi:hypothetical protein